MEPETGQQTTDIEKELIENGHSFSFFQAYRLLKSISKKKNMDVRVTSNPSLSFPAAGVSRIKRQDYRYDLISNMLGIYGTLSPLPTFYTEELIEEIANNEFNSKDFLDVINHRLYELLFDGWTKYKTMLKIVEQASIVDADRFFSLIGMGEESLRKHIDNPNELLRYTGLFIANSRSASGLKSMLKDAFNGIKIEIVQCSERQAIIPTEQRASLGDNIGLGENTLLGEYNLDTVGSFKIKVGPVSLDDYRKFFPEQEYHKKLILLTQLYLSQPFDYDFEVMLDKKEHPKTTQPGKGSWSGLGLDT
ncbi:MAG: type VI secretion system baseplate subunit TssG, partial [Desulfobacteraceae bacterium]|nr:type VI secretion system baseplate subunit TssG [Desulfobacteraceae bacterium]